MTRTGAAIPRTSSASERLMSVALPGETVATGAPVRCPGCQRRVPGPTVLRSPAGWFVGYGPCDCNPVYTRESGYYHTFQGAELALLTGAYSR